nr:two-component system sensor histidine kinase/response regulator, putative [Tanacetum cinerariifolium]
AKPCDPRELTARLRAVLRRSHPTAVSTQIELGDLCFSPARGVVTIDEQEFTLTVSEARLLEALLGQPGEPLEKQELAQLALGRKLTLYDRSLDMHEGFVVRACHDGQSARKALAESAPAAVVLDVMLPDGSGLELLKQLRTDHPDLPVLMLSARGEPLDRILGLELGADDYLAKPCDPRE